MNRKKIIGIGAIALVVAALGIFGAYKLFFAPKGHTKNLTDAPLQAAIVADYTKTEAEREETFASGSKGFSWENGDPFNVWWSADCADYSGGKLVLKLAPMSQKEQVWNADGTSSDCLSDYYGGEVRSEHYYGYGDFQVRMKPAAIPGTASTFFTCTGLYDVWYNADGTVERVNDHDEIDIEFLGKDTTRVQFNYFASGVGGHEYMYDLGFDASKEFHNYGYRWSEDSITWFVDEKPVYKVLRSEIPAGQDWPEEPGRIVMNYWCGTSNAALWMGKFKGDYSAGAEYEWVASSAQPQIDPSSTIPGGADVPDLDAPAEVLDFAGFDGWGKYTVTNNGDSVRITHDKKVDKYACCGMDLPLAGRNMVSYTVTNNGSETAFAKVSVKSTSEDKSAIQSATVNGGDAGYYEYGVLTQLAPGQSADVVMLLDLAKKPTQMVVSLNSEADEQGKALRADMPAKGDITISKLKLEASDLKALPGAGTGAAGEEEHSGGPKAPEGPDTQWAGLDLSAFDGWGKYTITNSGDKIRVTHDKKVDKYACCGGEINLGGRNKVKYTVTNNGAQTAYAKVSVKNTTSDKAAIQSATINGGDAGYYEYGVLTQLAPGQSADVVMLLDMAKKPTQMVVSLNSEADDQGKALRSDMPGKGDITLSNIQVIKSGETVLLGAGAPAQSTDEPAGGPQAPQGPEDQWAAIDLSGFDGWGKYTVARSGNDLTISHAKRLIRYDCCGANIALGGRNKVSYTVTNEGDTAAYAKVSIKNSKGGDKAAIQSATINGAAAGYIDYGVMTQLQPGESAYVEMLLDAAQAPDQIVVSLNSEGNDDGSALRSDMPDHGKIALRTLRAVKSDETSLGGASVQTPDTSDSQTTGQDNQAVAALAGMDGWGKYLLSRSGDAVTISHDAARTRYDCCGGDVDLGDDNVVTLTVTNTGDQTAYAKVSIKDKADTDGHSSIRSATVDGVDAGYVEYGVLCTLAPGQSSKVVLYLDKSKPTDQFIVSLNSEGNDDGSALRADMPAKGSVVISDFRSSKGSQPAVPGDADQPGQDQQGADTPSAAGDKWVSGYDGWGMYTVTKGDGSVRITHDQAVRQYACSGTELALGEDNKVSLTVTNNANIAAQVKVSIKDKTDEAGHSSLLKATVNGKDVGYVEYGALFDLAAGQSADVVLYLDKSKPTDQLVVSLNSESASGMPKSGDITVSGLQSTKSDEKVEAAPSRAPSRGSGGGGGGGAVARPGFTGELDVNTGKDYGWNDNGAYHLSGSNGKVTMKQTGDLDGTYAGHGWQIALGQCNKVDLDITNNSATQTAYAKVSVKDNNNEGISSIKYAVITPNAPALVMSTQAVLNAVETPLSGDAVKYGVMCTLAPGASSHVTMYVDPGKSVTQFTISLNSEKSEDMGVDMPTSGDITIENIVCTKAELPTEPDPGTDPGTDPEPTVTEPEWKGDIDLSSFGGWNSYTITDKSASAVTMSHAEKKSGWACEALLPQGGFGNARHVGLTVTNNADGPAKLQINFVDHAADDSETAAVSSYVVVRGAEKTSTTASEIKVDLAAQETVTLWVELKETVSANRMVVFLNSMQQASADDMPTTGSVTLSAAKWDKTSGGSTEPDPGTDPDPYPDDTPVEDDSLTDMGLTLAAAEGSNYVVTGTTITHTGAPYWQWMDVNSDVVMGNATKVQLTVKNNSADTPAVLKIKLQGDNYAGFIATGAVTIGSEAIESTKDDGLLATIPAGKTAVYTLTIDAADAASVKQLELYLNSTKASDNAASGDITVTRMAWNKTGGTTPPTPEKPAAPTASPAPGTDFTETQQVTLTAQQGAAIYYTTDGTTPTESSTAYSGTITAPAGDPGVATTTTIKAIARLDGVNSEVATFTYVVTAPAPTPETYTVTYQLTNLTKDVNAPANVTEGDPLSVTLTADDGYTLPETVTVTMGGTAQDGVYNSATGAITIASVTGDVVITAEGVEENIPVTVTPEHPAGEGWTMQSLAGINKDGTNYTAEAGNEGATATISHTAKATPYGNASVAINKTVSKVWVKIKNLSADTAATVKVSVQNIELTDGAYKNIAESAKVDSGEAMTGGAIEWGVSVSIPAESSSVFEMDLGNAGKLAKTLAIALNSEASGEPAVTLESMPAQGNVAITGVYYQEVSTGGVDITWIPLTTGLWGNTKEYISGSAPALDYSFCAGGSDLALNGANTVKFALKNNDTTETAYIRVKFEVGGATAIASAEVNETAATLSDYDKSFDLTIEPNGTAQVQFALSETSDTNQLTIFLNCIPDWFGDGTAKPTQPETGSITISGLSCATVSTPGTQARTFGRVREVLPPAAPAAKPPVEDEDVKAEIPSEVEETDQVMAVVPETPVVLPEEEPAELPGSDEESAEEATVEAVSGEAADDGEEEA